MPSKSDEDLEFARTYLRPAIANRYERSLCTALGLPDPDRDKAAREFHALISLLVALSEKQFIMDRASGLLPGGVVDDVKRLTSGVDPTILRIIEADTDHERVEIMEAYAHPANAAGSSDTGRKKPR